QARAVEAQPEAVRGRPRRLLGQDRARHPAAAWRCPGAPAGQGAAPDRRRPGRRRYPAHGRGAVAAVRDPAAPPRRAPGTHGREPDLGPHHEDGPRVLRAGDPLPVKNDEIRGLGGFGSAPKGQSINLLVREVVIPLADSSLFHGAVVDAKSYSGALPEGKWSSYLMGKIGRFSSSAVSLMPLVTHRETIAVLFGDNPETGRPFGRLDALEVFVNQAGVALERVFLQRKLQALQGRA